MATKRKTNKAARGDRAAADFGVLFVALSVIAFGAQGLIALIPSVWWGLLITLLAMGAGAAVLLEWRRGQ
jgi:hypothetical protein